MTTEDGRPILASAGRSHSMSHLFFALLILAQGVGSSSAFVLRHAESRPRPAALRIPTREARLCEQSSRNSTRLSDRITMRLLPDHFRIASLGSSPAPPRRRQRRMIPRSLQALLRRLLLVQIPSKIRELSVRFKRSALILALAVCLLSSFGMSAGAVGAGRAGGSFGPAASSSHSSRSYSSSSSTNLPRMSSSYNRLPPQIRVYSQSSSYSPPIVIIQRNRFKARHRPTVYTTLDKKRKGDQDEDAVAPSSFASPDVATSFSVGDIVLLTGAGSLITYGFYNNFRAGNDGSNLPNSALGPGATVARLVVVLNQRPGGRTVLDDIRDMSERADTSTRRGVQELVSSVALELLRREASIGSAFTQSAHFPTSDQADREFQRQSIRNRAKFDNESFSKFGSEPTLNAQSLHESSGLVSSATEASASAGLAVVSMHISILGDSTQLPAIRDRTNALLALNRLAADAKIDDCLMAAEILWAPDDRDEIITMDDLVTDYPELVAL